MRAQPNTLFVGGRRVSRETMERLGAYRALLMKWNRAINLVSPASLDDVWRRHIRDSAQIVPLIPTGAQSLVDMGSGAGLPGLIVAILARELVPGLRVESIEADRRKAEFQRTVVRSLDLPVAVHAARLENRPCGPADVVCARALASLDRLLGHASAYMHAESVALFPKGARLEAEIREAQKRWEFDFTVIPSETDPQGSIIQIRDLRGV